MDKGIAKSWQYFTPEQIGIPYWRVREIQNIVGTGVAGNEYEIRFRVFRKK